MGVDALPGSPSDLNRKWNRGRNGLHQLEQPVAPSILFPVFKSEGEPGIPRQKHHLQEG